MPLDKSRVFPLNGGLYGKQYVFATNTVCLISGCLVCRLLTYCASLILVTPCKFLSVDAYETGLK